ncbi:30S ribosomal protein S8 [Candidatus Calditenuaceae archaeon HR02]|nr:30S ribosomal protein S8 [Candidatus Calditenuaceae archaeon HR02]
MVSKDLVSGLFTTLQNNEAVRNKECIYYYSRLIGDILRTLQRHSYIGSFEYIEDGRGGKVIIQLLGRINRAAPIRPRYSVSRNGYDSWAKLYLPAKDVGILIVTTNQGVLSHREAVSRGLGGKLLGYVY